MPLVSNKQYEFEYNPIKYKNNTIHPNIELVRWECIKTAKIKIVDILKKNNIKPIKGDLDTNVENLMARIMFDVFSSDVKELDDGLLNFSDKSLLNDLTNTFIIDNINVLFSNIKTFIENHFKSYLNKIENIDCTEKHKCHSSIKKNKFIVSYNNHIIWIPITIYNKLKKRYKEHGDKKIKLNDIVTCLCLRYDALSSIGNQMGIPIQVKEQLKKCGVDFEGFASAFNHHCYYYCSMFYDIEKHFGSLGLYQNIKYIRGTFMLNPPYEKNLLHRMVDKIITSLSSKKKLCFIFGTPSWDNYSDIYFHKKASSSKYFKIKYKFNNYQVWWYDFIYEKYIKIPSSTRYILANYDMDLDCLKKAIQFWIDLIIF